jgi:predicted 3-demethylubiquinone-9 3-methyltransferase (glyoxalase superfamily)
MKIVSPILMFDGKAEEAMKFYVSLFESAKVTHVTRYGANETGKEGSIQRAVFSLNGQEFICMDSVVKHNFTFTPAISIYVGCSSDQEITSLFNQLSVHGEIFMPLGKYAFSEKFGWCADRFGLCWQLNLENG